MTIFQQFSPELCPLCGEANTCQLCSPATHKGPCWCAKVEMPEELLSRIPEAYRNRACICRKCVESFHTQRQLSEVRSPATRHATGFTLIELLVVIAIIAILAA